MGGVCKVNGCDAPVFVKSRGLCSKHYNRLLTTGTTNDGPKARARWQDRFWRHVEKGGQDECWVWKGGRGSFGYGKFNMGGRGAKQVNAHRAAYEIAYGPVPEGLQVNHRCRNRACVNPAHLYVGTQSQNMEDRHRGGTDLHWQRPQGEKHKNAKLTDDQVRFILQSPRSGADLAKEFGVTKEAIYYVRNCGWRHLK